MEFGMKKVDGGQIPLLKDNKAYVLTVSPSSFSLCSGNLTLINLLDLPNFSVYSTKLGSSKQQFMQQPDRQSEMV